MTRVLRAVPQVFVLMAESSRVPLLVEVKERKKEKRGERV